MKAVAVAELVSQVAHRKFGLGVGTSHRLHGAPARAIWFSHARRIAVMSDCLCTTPSREIDVERTVSAPACETENATELISSALARKQFAKASKISTSWRRCGGGFGLFLGDAIVAGII